MNALGTLGYFLSALLVQVPVLVVSLLGFVLALTRWRSAPAAARWTLAASILSVFICVGAPFTQQVITHSMQTYALTTAQVGNLFSVASFTWGLLRAVNYGMLLAAAFVGRSSPAAPYPGPLPPPAGYVPPSPPPR